MSTPLIVYDRSRVTTDWGCPRRRYLQYEYNGKGIVPAHQSYAPYLGNLLHDGLAAIATFTLKGEEVPIDAIADAGVQQMREVLLANTTGEVEAVNYAFEQGALVEGQLRGFYKHVWPILLSTYPEILLIEQEMEFRHDGLVFMSKPDLVVRGREGEVWYIEYKSTRSKNQGWVNSWQTAVQLHSTIKAIEEHINEKVTGVVIQGLYKGYESYGKQSSPFCYGYRRSGNPPFTKDEVRYDFAPGFRKTPTWEMGQGKSGFKGVKGWVEDMPTSILADQFPQVPPIFIKEGLLDSFFKQRAVREQEINLALNMMDGADREAQEIILDTAFEQHWDECNQYYGGACAYKPICHGASIFDVDPLDNHFVYRTPHHALELEQDQASNE